jgi:O-methyltransferase
VPTDCDESTARIIRAVQPYTLTSPERIMGLCEAVSYLERAGISGPIVECGVWRGGSVMAAAMRLLELNSTQRSIFMFDTFDISQIPMAGPNDVSPSGKPLTEGFEEAIQNPGIFASFPAERVQSLIAGTGYPLERLHLVKGTVEETIPAKAPDSIALCRLDTDYYESTAHEMRHLFPRIAPGGVLIVDDYGDFPGCRKAVDEYLEANDVPLLLNRLDSSGRLAIVPERR